MGDTSADEVCGHQFAFPAAYTVLGNVTGQESMLYNRINVMVGTIVENGYYLVGHDGKHTKYEAAVCFCWLRPLPLSSFDACILQVGHLGSLLRQRPTLMVRSAWP